MHVWQLQEAKAKLTELINDAQREPQIISRRNVHETVVMSMEKYKELCGAKESIVSFFQNSPLQDCEEVEFKRDKRPMRKVRL